LQSQTTNHNHLYPFRAIVIVVVVVATAACRRTGNRAVNQSAPSTPQIDIKKAPSFTQEQPHLDAYERALRQRKQEVSTANG
jgi:hypothetical protein